MLAFQETGLVLVILGLGILLTILGGRVVKEIPLGSGSFFAVPVFLQSDNILGLLNNTSWYAIMAVGATLVIISGGIDLSVGSVYCLAGVCGALVGRALGPAGAWAHASDGLSILAVPAVTMAVGAACGCANGLLIVLLRVHPFVITLGTMAILRTLAFLVTHGKSVTDIAPAYRSFFSRHWRIGAEPMAPILVMAGLTAIGMLYLRATAAGRHTLAIGGNEEASRYSGLRTGRVKIGVYTLAGLTAGIAAAVAVGYWGSAQSSDGKGYELIVIASAVVGGASLAGGRGSVLGAMLGAIIIKLIENGVVVLGLKSEASPLVFGVVIILAVVFDQVKVGLSRRHAMRRAGAGTKPGGRSGAASS